MSWNYRVLVETKDRFGNLTNDQFYYITEVYYDADGNPNGYAQEPTHLIGGNSLDDLQSILDLCKLAFKEPILYSGDKFPDIYKPE